MTHASTTPAAPAAGTDTAYGVLQLGPAQIALPLDALREVIPCPPRFSGLPATAPGLLGAVSVRGKVVPVLDLRVPLGLPAAVDTSQVVVLLRHEGAVLGLLTDGVRGLTRVPAEALNPMAACGDGLLFSGSFERGEDHTVVSVLDVAAVMRRPGVPLMRDATPAEDDSRQARAAERKALMLVRAGRIGLAMDVTEIHTTLPRVNLLPSSMDGRVCRGVIEHAGARIPAIDPLALMDLGSLLDPGTCQALLLRYEAGMVALLVHQVIDIVRVPESECLALPALALRRPEFFRAVLKLPDRGDHLLLGTRVLQQVPELVTFSTLNTRAKGAGEADTVAGKRSTATGVGAAVITYDIGAEVATRLGQVSEVLTMPSGHARPQSAHPAVLGMCTHRGHAVTMVCLASLLGSKMPPELDQGRVLLVSEGDAHFGFVVPRLCHIENTVWEQPGADRGPEAGHARHPLGQHAVVELGQGAQRRTLHLIDLRALVRSLLAPPPVDTAIAAVAETAAPAEADLTTAA